MRDLHGRIARSKKAVSMFRATVPCPATGKISKTCPGYIADHIVSLCACGADDPSNMQFQTLADSKIKDRWEAKAVQGRKRLKSNEDHLAGFVYASSFHPCRNTFDGCRHMDLFLRGWKRVTENIQTRHQLVF